MALTATITFDLGQPHARVLIARDRLTRLDRTLPLSYIPGLLSTLATREGATQEAANAGWPTATRLAVGPESWVVLNGQSVRLVQRFAAGERDMRPYGATNPRRLAVPARWWMVQLKQREDGAWQIRDGNATWLLVEPQGATLNGLLTPVSSWPYGNVNSNGVVCWGHNTLERCLTPADVDGYFLSSPFNLDLTGEQHSQSNAAWTANALPARLGNDRNITTVEAVVNDGASVGWCRIL